MTGVTPWTTEKQTRLRTLFVVEKWTVSKIALAMQCRTTTVRNRLAIIGIKTKADRPERVYRAPTRVEFEPVAPVDPDARLRRFSWENMSPRAIRRGELCRLEG